MTAFQEFFFLFIGAMIPLFYYWIVVRKWKAKHSGDKLEDIEPIMERNKAFAATASLNATILQTLDLPLLTKHIANTIPKFLGYQTAALAIIDEDHGVLRRVAVSDTEGAVAALQLLEIPFKEIKIGLSEEDNYCIKAIKNNRVYVTDDIYNVLRPAVSKENAVIVQRAMGTKITIAFPIYSTTEKKALGVFLVSANKSEREISEFEWQALNNFVDGIRIALVNANLYTSLHNITKDLQAANDKLKELDDLKTDFISIASHQLRTPLTAIKGYSSMIIEGTYGDSSPQIKGVVDKIFQSAQRLIYIVNDLLDVSRIEQGRFTVAFEEVNLVNVIRDVTEELKVNAEKKNIALSFEVGVDDAEIKVNADFNKIRQVFTNLVDNALKYTDTGYVKVSVKTQGDNALVSVKDSGIGISASTIPNLFQKFTRAKGAAKLHTDGTGLGLYVAREIVKAHHGEVWVESEGEGKGSQFYVLLPLKNSKTEEAEQSIGGM